jgi:tetratricopeptide (TPR) repeat protein
MAIVLALGVAAAALQREREQLYPTPVVDSASLYVTSGTTLRRLTAGYNAVAADLYWIRTIQYYGDVKQRLARVSASDDRTSAERVDYQQLYPLLDLTTSLDPQFNIAYRFGAIFLAEAYPGGAGRPDLAIALLEKGIRDRPDKWEYMQDIGFVHYWWRRDYRSASEWFERASRVPGAPWFLKSIAATTLAEGGDRQSSRTMWESIRASAEIDWLKRDAERRLMQLDVMDFIPTVQAAVDRAIAATGTTPRDWNSLIGARVVPGIPVDPTKTPYEIDESGHVILSPQSPLYPLPSEPQRIGAPGA